jgi:protein TonB
VNALELRHRLLGAAAALSGTAVVFGLVIAMNEFSEGLPYDDRPQATSFEVSAPPPPPEPEPEPRPRQEVQPVDAPPPPLAELSSEVGGVDIPVPGLDDSELDQSAVDGGADKDLVMTDETVDTPPRPTEQVPMKYPSEAKRKGIQGYVTLSLLIGDDGHVQRVRVLESEPHGIFDEAASDAVRQWAFEPAQYKGQSVKVWARQTIRFALN